MARERPPNPLHPSGPRPGSRQPPHRVQYGETLETIARTYRVPLEQLLIHNFGTTEPEEINWYLHYYVGCNLGTHDHLNWRFSDMDRFSRAPDAGLIYIPERVIEMDPITINVGGARPKVNLNLLHRDFFLASGKWAFWDLKYPLTGPTDTGYLRWQLVTTADIEVKQVHGFLKTSIKIGDFKAYMEHKLVSDLKVGLGATADQKVTHNVFKINEKVLEPIAEYIKKHKAREDAHLELRKVLAKMFEASIKNTYKWQALKLTPDLPPDTFSLAPEAGIDLSQGRKGYSLGMGIVRGTPLFVGMSGAYEGYFMFKGVTFVGKVTLKGGFYVGLSAKAWAWIADRVGAAVLRQFLAQGGRALAQVGEWLVSEGVLTAGTIVVGAVAGAAGLAALCAWVTADVTRKGQAWGLSSWYSRGYADKVWGRPRHRPSTLTDFPELRDKLIELGENEAVPDARAAAAKINGGSAPVTDQRALELYRSQLIAESRGSEEWAEQKLRQALDEKVRMLAG